MTSNMLERLIDYILMFYLVITIIVLIAIIVIVAIDKIGEFRD